jgi:hypothetical protein
MPAIPQEDAVLDALRSLNVPTGQYLAPYANTPAQMKQPEYMEKRKRGPALFLTLAAGAPYPSAFNFICVAALMGYALGHAHQSIWYRQKWRTTVNHFIDGLICSLLTAGVFGWLWPR